MERIFSNVYRWSQPGRIGANRYGLTHTYFLKRKEGNLLVPHQTPPAKEDLDQIEDLGGIESQWVCHNHDVIKGGAHGELFERFGCRLHYHEAERQKVRKKTKCPEVEFDDRGTRHGGDFEVLFLPTCTPGHSIFRWRSRGKYYLITSHAIYLRDGAWDLSFYDKRSNEWRPQLSKLAKLHVDYVFPGYTALDEPGFFRLGDQERKSFAQAVRLKSREAVAVD